MKYHKLKVTTSVGNVWKSDWNCVYWIKENVHGVVLYGVREERLARTRGFGGNAPDYYYLISFNKNLIYINILINNSSQVD